MLELLDVTFHFSRYSTMQTPFELPSLKTYPGGKGADGTYQRLINEIPAHENYIEPFLGRGSILRYKKAAESINLGLELDERIFRIWKQEAPAWVKVRNTCGLEYLDHIATRALDDSYAYDETFIFLDPPYINETLSNGLAPYQHRFTYDDHIRLLNTLNRIDKACDAMLMVCALPNLLYESMLKGWRTFQYQNKTRHGMQTEQVWVNYPVPERLHDTRYVGATYRDRERLKKNANGIIRRLERMNPLERQAIMERISTHIR